MTHRNRFFFLFESFEGDPFVSDETGETRRADEEARPNR